MAIDKNINVSVTSPLANIYLSGIDELLLSEYEKEKSKLTHRERLLEQRSCKLLSGFEAKAQWLTAIYMTAIVAIVAAGELFYCARFLGVVVVMGISFAIGLTNAFVFTCQEFGMVENDVKALQKCYNRFYLVVDQFEREFRASTSNANMRYIPGLGELEDLTERSMIDSLVEHYKNLIWSTFFLSVGQALVCTLLPYVFDAIIHAISPAVPLSSSIAT